MFLQYYSASVYYFGYYTTGILYWIYAWTYIEKHVTVTRWKEIHQRHIFQRLARGAGDNRAASEILVCRCHMGNSGFSGHHPMASLWHKWSESSAPLLRSHLDGQVPLNWILGSPRSFSWNENNWGWISNISQHLPTFPDAVSSVFFFSWAVSPPTLEPSPVSGRQHGQWTSVRRQMLD